MGWCFYTAHYYFYYLLQNAQVFHVESFHPLFIWKLDQPWSKTGLQLSFIPVMYFKQWHAGRVMSAHLKQFSLFLFPAVCSFKNIFSLQVSAHLKRFSLSLSLSLLMQTPASTSSIFLLKKTFKKALI